MKINLYSGQLRTAEFNRLRKLVAELSVKDIAEQCGLDTKVVREFSKNFCAVGDPATVGKIRNFIKAYKRKKRVGTDKVFIERLRTYCSRRDVCLSSIKKHTGIAPGTIMRILKKGAGAKINNSTAVILNKLVNDDLPMQRRVFSGYEVVEVEEEHYEDAEVVYRMMSGITTFLKTTVKSGKTTTQLDLREYSRCIGARIIWGHSNASEDGEEIVAERLLAFIDGVTRILGAQKEWEETTQLHSEITYHQFLNRLYQYADVFSSSSDYQENEEDDNGCSCFNLSTEKPFREPESSTTLPVIEAKTRK